MQIWNNFPVTNRAFLDTSSERTSKGFSGVHRWILPKCWGHALFCHLYHRELGGGSPELQEAGRGWAGGGRDPYVRSEMVCHGGWPHATEPKSAFYLTIGEQHGKKKEPYKKTKQKKPQTPKVRKRPSEPSRFTNPFKADANQTGWMHLELCWRAKWLQIVDSYWVTPPQS